MKVIIEVIPHQIQRYDTAGDWQWEPNKDDPITSDRLIIRVSDTGNWRSNMLVAVHELAEAILCKAHGISQEQVDAWDLGPGKALAEPGNDHRAPYFNEHCVAEYIEQALAQEIISWREHETNLAKLDWSGGSVAMVKSSEGG